MISSEIDFPEFCGISVSPQMRSLILVLANSSSRSLPAYLLSPPLSTRSNWSAMGACQRSPSTRTVTTFNDLFTHSFDDNDLAHLSNGTHTSLPYIDTPLRLSLTGLGPELRDLVKQTHIIISHQHGKLFVGLSKQLQRGVWEFFAKDSIEYRLSRASLITLVACYLPDPYTDPIWETKLLSCKELVTSTLIPVLCSWPRSATWPQHLLTETTVCILAFNLALLGFPLGEIPWDCLIENLLHPDAKLFIETQKQLSPMLHNGASPSTVVRWLESIKPFESVVSKSLFWITIARICRTSILELQIYCKARHPWNEWESVNTDSSRSEIEEIAFCLLSPESINIEFVSSRLSSPSLGALGAGLSQSGHMQASLGLLELSLNSYSRSSITYGVLFAELLKNYNKVGKAEEARKIGYEYLRGPHDSLPADRPVRIHIMIAISDACIVLKEYEEARKLLSDVLSRSDLNAYTEICSALRLNKVWRRESDENYEPHFARNLDRVLSLSLKENTPVKKEFLTELQATAYHTKQAQEPLSPSLRAIVDDTLHLYQESDNLFHESLTGLSHLSQIDTDTVPSDIEHSIAHKRSDNNSYVDLPEINHPSSNSLVSNRFLSVIGSRVILPSDNRSHAPSRPSSLSIVDIRARGTQNNPDRSSAKNKHVKRQSSEFSVKDVNWKKRNLLSLDGGGTRGYWTLLVLQKLMEAVKEEEIRQAIPSDHGQHLLLSSFYPELCPKHLDRNATKFLPCHYFDLICGSDTGALIAMMLSKFRMTVSDCLQQFESISKRTYGKPRPASRLSIGISPWSKYSAKAMEESLKSLTAQYGEDDHMRTAPGTCASLIVTMEERAFRHNVYLIRSYGRSGPELNRDERVDDQELATTTELKTWEVARAATAAPLFFKGLKRSTQEVNGPQSLSYGGFGGANDTTPIALRELERLHGKDSVGTIVSVGTARPMAIQSLSILNRVREAFAKAATDSSIVATQLATQHLESYWRFNDSDGIDIARDEWNPNGITTRNSQIGKHTMEKITHAFNVWVSRTENNRLIEKCAQELVARRRGRTANQERWKVFATGVRSGDDNNREQFTVSPAATVLFESVLDSQFTEDLGNMGLQFTEDLGHMGSHFTEDLGNMGLQFSEDLGDIGRLSVDQARQSPVERTST